MTIPVLAIAVGALLIYAAIAGLNPIEVIKTVLGGGGAIVTGANTGAAIGTGGG